MKVQEIYRDKPTKTIADLVPGEVFKYDGEWFMVVAVNVDPITFWSAFVTKHIHNPHNVSWSEYDLTTCIHLESGNLRLLSDDWIIEDYGEAEMRVLLEQ